MAGRMIAARVFVGRDVNVVRETGDGLDLAGRVRLRPGHSVVVVLPRPIAGDETTRRAVVWSWNLVALGSGGPLYRGLCHWE